MKNIVLEQLEFGMKNNLRRNIRNVRQERLKRAQWWFKKMREVVDLALPPQPMVSPRPEQTYFSRAYL